MKRARHGLLVSLALAGGVVGAGSAAAISRLAIPLDRPAAATCGSQYLASPSAQQAHSADYYVDQNVVQPGATVQVHLGAYALPGGAAPDIVENNTLDNSYHQLDQRPDKGGNWHVNASCNASAPVQGATSLYYYEGAWTAPSNPGSYELAVTFRFQDKTTALSVIVDYLVNMQVAPAGRTGPGIKSHIHDQINLTSDAGTTYAQNTVNNGYDLRALGDRAHLSTEYDWTSQPVAGDRRVADGLLSTIGNTLPTFSNVDESAGNGDGRGGGAGSDNRIPLPSPDFPYIQQSTDYTGTTTPLPQHGAASFGPYSQAIGAQPYNWRALIDAPVTVRDGATYRLKVGRYVMDNGFFGALADGSDIANFGDGQSVAFYADPKGPYYDPTGAHCDHNPRLACIWWTPVAASAIGRYTTATYHLGMVNTAKPGPGGEQDIVTADTTKGWADVAASRPATYQAGISVEYTFTDGGQALGDPLFGTPQQATLTFAAGASPGDTPTPANTPTPVPTDTATPLPLTDTPTPLPPTATPTPARGALALDAAPTPRPYAWLFDGKADSVSGTDTLAPTTSDDNPRPSDFSWPIGRPLHLLPALSDRPDEVRLTLSDLGNGASADIAPVAVTSESYGINDIGCGAPTDPISGTYAHDPAYPAEIRPVTHDRAGFPSAINVVWTNGDSAGAGAGGPYADAVCDIPSYLAAHHQTTVMTSGIPIAFTVGQRLDFAVRFPAGAPPATSGVSTICQLAPEVAAGPTPTPLPEPDGVTPPAPAFTSPISVPIGGSCAARDVGLAAAEQALNDGAIAVPVGADAHLLPQASGQVYDARPAPGGDTMLTFSVETTWRATLHYHPLFLREVSP